MLTFNTVIFLHYLNIQTCTKSSAFAIQERFPLLLIAPGLTLYIALIAKLNLKAHLLLPSPGHNYIKDA